MATILVVDDDTDYCDLLKLYFERKGHIVFVADTAKVALTMYAHQKPDIIISDILMPEMDGIEFLLAINKADNKSLRGIIMISGGGIAIADPYLDMAKSLGATKVFAKPISLESLNTAICEILGIKRI